MFYCQSKYLLFCLNWTIKILWQRWSQDPWWYWIPDDTQWFLWYSSFIKKFTESHTQLHHSLYKSSFSGIVSPHIGGKTIGGLRCGSEDCLLCLTEDKEEGRCRKTNLVYKTTCNTCTSLGSRCEYWGETSRSSYLRGPEHLKYFTNKTEQSNMFKHIQARNLQFNLQDPENRKAENLFKMKIQRRYRTAMEHQLSEAILITKAVGLDSDYSRN